MKSQKEMGHFIGWKFGTPVRIFNINGVQTDDFVYLINETKMYFTVMSKAGNVEVFSKSNRSYELIPYKYSAFSPRYPVCSSPDFTAYCNARFQMTTLDSTSQKLQQYPTVTFAIDSITIKFSAETTAELKKELGIQPTIMDVDSAIRLREYMDSNELEHLLPPVRPKLVFNHLNLMLLAPKYRKAVLRESELI